MLASFLLNEELGHLGRTGCALCLIGSIIIVLHAPPDKEIETVDEILHYAIQPGGSTFVYLIDRLLIWRRLYVVLPYRLHLHVCHDFQRCTSLRPLNPFGLHLNMLPCRLRLCHGDQRIRRRCQTHLGWKQPIYASKHVRVRYSCDKLHIGADELLQQGSRHVLHECVRPSSCSPSTTLTRRPLA